MFQPEYHVTLSGAAPLVRDCMVAGVVPMLRGSPALGKSALIHSVARTMNLAIIDARFAGFDPTDVNGFPAINEKRGIAEYYPLETFPLGDWDLPEGKSGWLLFMDEFNSAPPAVQAASYKLVLDRMVGQRKLHENVYMVAAGNLDSDGAITHEMSTALISRIANLQIKPDVKGWLEWAMAEGGIHSLITSFIQWKGKNFYTFDDKDPNQPFASPRTWEFVNKLMKVWQANNEPISKKMPLLVGLLGQGVAVEFKAFASIRGELPTKEEVIAAPETCRLPADLGPTYAMTGAIPDWAEDTNLEAMIKYVSRLAPADMQVTALRNLLTSKPQFKNHPVITNWMKANMERFIGRS